jgi:hypothetical protein
MFLHKLNAGGFASVDPLLLPLQLPQLPHPLQPLFLAPSTHGAGVAASVTPATSVT